MPNIKVSNTTTIPVNSVVQIKMPESITNRPHVFIGYTFLNAGVVVTPGAGTILFTATPENIPDVALPLDSSPSAIDATLAVPELPNLAGNITSVTVNSTGITGADEVRIIVTANES